MKALLPLALIAVIAALRHPVSAAPGLPEYTAAEAPKHIGEKATVAGKVGCIDAGRTYHMLSLDGCTPTSPFWIIVNDDASGPDLNVHDLKGVTIAVTGKIERPQTQPWMIVKSTTQIQTRSPINTDYISHAHEKEAQGDLDGAIELFNQAIEHQSDRRNEAYEFIARIKERKGDWNGALASYDAMVAVDPNKGNSYYTRATAKKQHGDFEGAIADFTRAAELRSSGAGYLEVASLRKDHGDLAGAMATYDKGIEVLNAEIARAPEALLYYQRGYANELKGDVDAAVADYSRAIEMHPSYMACAYSRRGDIRKAHGDRAGAIADYEHAVKYAQLDEDKKKLKHARTEVEREQAPLADSKSVYGDDKATASLSRTAHPQAASKQYANSDTADDAESPTALVTRAKLRIRTGDFDGAIEDCDRALRVSRGGSKEAYDLRIQAMKAKGTSKSAFAQRVTSKSQEEQPIVPTTEPGSAVSKPKNAEVVDIPAAQANFGIKAGNIRVRFSDGHSEILTRTGNCMEPKVSLSGHVGWTQCSGFDRKSYAMNQNLIVHLRSGVTKQFKANPNSPFIGAWTFVDNDSGVLIQSRGFHGPASYVRYDLGTGRKTNEKVGTDDSEALPEWAQAPYD